MLDSSCAAISPSTSQFIHPKVFFISLPIPTYSSCLPILIVMFFKKTALVGMIAISAHAAHLSWRAESVKVSNYTYTGSSTGPFNWANLQGWYQGANKVCATGKKQSPINLDSSIQTGEAPTINYPDGNAMELENIGTTLEVVNKGTASYSIVVGDRTFLFNNFHFHTPSEHRINGESFPLEMHIVNAARDPANNVVLTVLFNIGTSANAFLTSVLQNAASVTSPGSTTMTGNLNFTPIRNAFASSAARKVYEGSLTTPPCTENTQFIIATTPLTMSIAQYNTIKGIIKFNARYTQNALGQTNLLQISQPRS
ncbi:carbonic anhydrase [Pseudovirgaria hyperparasitica]|uniref:Carbonic anhydrase n=1 Tax=Pseudovirgaria hyperparasitica TaxID=470096 RepID=A0A6A6VZC8_9PEZI|nr:carbonic anhydrase [Pseudovirgaria hyperparasitica]KAF2755050.1 carbonic anhydrase [Pseudovirgaria hyperparasitica]